MKKLRNYKIAIDFKKLATEPWFLCKSTWKTTKELKNLASQSNSKSCQWQNGETYFTGYMNAKRRCQCRLRTLVCPQNLSGQDAFYCDTAVDAFYSDFHVSSHQPDVTHWSICHPELPNENTLFCRLVLLPDFPSNNQVPAPLIC